MLLRSIKFNKFGALSHVPINETNYLRINQINVFKDCIPQVLFGPYFVSNMTTQTNEEKEIFLIFHSYVSNLFVILRNILKVKFFNDKTVFKEVLI